MCGRALAAVTVVTIVSYTLFFIWKEVGAKTWIPPCDVQAG